MASTRPPKLFQLTLTPSNAWHAAIERWMEGDSTKVRQCLIERRPIPKFAREWLADALDGKIPKNRGRKPRAKSVAEGAADIYHQLQIVERFKLALVMERARDWAEEKRGRVDDSPKNRALASVSAEFGLSEDAISRIVYPRRARNSKK